MKVERTQRTLASAGNWISEFVAARPVSATTDRDREETGARHQQPAPDEEANAPSQEGKSSTENEVRLLNITA